MFGTSNHSELISELFASCLYFFFNSLQVLDECCHMLSIQYKIYTKFVKRHVAVASEATSMTRVIVCISTLLYIASMIEQWLKTVTCTGCLSAYAC